MSRDDRSVTRTRRTVSVDDTTQEGAQQPVASTAAEIMAGKIGDLCLAIRQATVQSANVSSNSCIGVLVDERERVLHRIWPTAAESPYITEAVSLGTLLVPGLLEKGVRLKLGVQLASTVMQLHASEWLGEN